MSATDEIECHTCLVLNGTHEQKTEAAQALARLTMPEATELVVPHRDAVDHKDSDSDSDRVLSEHTTVPSSPPAPPSPAQVCSTRM